MPRKDPMAQSSLNEKERTLAEPEVASNRATFDGRIVSSSRGVELELKKLY
jgi:hypothetical protein